MATANLGIFLDIYLIIPTFVDVQQLDKEGMAHYYQ